jgi:hypothetical protein
MCGIAPSCWIHADYRQTSISSRVISDEYDWELYGFEAYKEYLSEFDALFNSYETKWSKNGRLMIRQGNSGSYTFAKKG